MDPNLFLPLGLVAALAAALVARWWFGKSRRPSAVIEMWAYLREPKLPPQDAVVDLMIRGQGRAGTLAGPVTPREGLLLSDIRLHVGLVLRSKNPRAFRPDLMLADEPLPEHLTGLNEAEALARICYASDKPLKDARHLKFVPSMALAYAQTAGSGVVYDPVVERLWLVGDYEKVLQSHTEDEAFDAHVAVVWREVGDGFRAVSAGLRKVGLPELASTGLDADQRVLALELVGAAAKTAWKSGRLESTLTVTVFNDEFELHLGEPRNGVVPLKILRRQLK